MIWIKAKVRWFADIDCVIKHDIDGLIAEEIVEVLVTSLLILFLLIGVSNLTLNKNIAYQIIYSELNGIVLALF